MSRDNIASIVVSANTQNCNFVIVVKKLYQDTLRQKVLPKATHKGFCF